MMNCNYSLERSDSFEKDIQKREGKESAFGTCTPRATPIRHLFELDQRKSPLLARSNMNEKTSARSQYTDSTSECNGTWKCDAIPSEHPCDFVTTNKRRNLSNFLPLQSQHEGEATVGQVKTFASKGIGAHSDLLEARDSPFARAFQKLPSPCHLSSSATIRYYAKECHNHRNNLTMLPVATMVPITLGVAKFLPQLLSWEEHNLLLLCHPWSRSRSPGWIVTCMVKLS